MFAALQIIPLSKLLLICSISRHYWSVRFCGGCSNRICRYEEIQITRFDSYVIYSFDRYLARCKSPIPRSILPKQDPKVPEMTGGFRFPTEIYAPKISNGIDSHRAKYSTPSAELCLQNPLFWVLKHAMILKCCNRNRR